MEEKSFKDQSGGLIAMGVVEILIGTLLGLMAVLMISVGTVTTGYSLSFKLSPFFIYLTLAAWFVLMGIGTIRKTRWARMLMLASSWLTLLVGVSAIGFMAFILPQTVNSANMPKEAAAIAASIAILVIGLIYLGFPLVGILFYSNRNVRATCEHRHPSPSWTERCPLPVLILSLLMFLGVFSVAMQFTTNFTHPFFGILLSGTPGLAAWLINGLLCVLIAVGLYKLKTGAWWGVLVYYAALVASSVLTFSQITMDDFYAAANYPEAMRVQMQQFPWMNEHWLIKISLLYSVPILIYLLFIKRYFEKSNAEEHSND